MDSYRRSKAQSILEKHINELGSIYEKKEAEQKILDQKINNSQSRVGEVEKQRKKNWRHC